MKGITKFRRKLQDGVFCLGASVTLSDPLISDALGDSVDFIWVDLEHGGMSPEALAGHLLAARSRRVPALVRVPGSGAAFIKPVLDAGADGVIVPQVKSVEEVRTVVSDCRYHPLGLRGYGPRVPSNYGRNGGREYAEDANRDLFVAVQIETSEALQCLDEIVAVPGLDSVVIGPWDLSAAMGIFGEVEHPRILSEIERIASKARAAGLFVGAGMGTDPNYACALAKRGVQWVQLGCDYSYLVSFMNQITSRVRERLGEATATSSPAR